MCGRRTRERDTPNPPLKRRLGKRAGEPASPGRFSDTLAEPRLQPRINRGQFMTLQITMCVCMRMPFARLLPVAREQNWDLATLMRETGCGDNCGLCRPYLRRMLQTGETVFHEVIAE
jgi:bacterioferritin-associated ferredoxin